MDGFDVRLREAIAAAGLTQLQLAREIGVHPNLVSSWARGQSLPSAPNLASLVSALRADADWLLLGRSTPRDRSDPVAEKVRRLETELIELVDLARNRGDAAR